MTSTKYPNSIDTDAELPRVSDNISQISSEHLNAMRDAIIAIEKTLGSNPQGTTANLVTRLAETFNDDGTFKASALIAAGLIALPIINSQIGASAAIEESKLDLDVATQSLQDQINLNDIDIAELQRVIADLLNRFSRHINGTAFRHDSYDIDLDSASPGSTPAAFIDLTSINVGQALIEINNNFIDHKDLAKIDAHQAINIGFDPTNALIITADEVQTALEQLDSYKDTIVRIHRDDMHANGFSKWSNDIDGYDSTNQKVPTILGTTFTANIPGGRLKILTFTGESLSTLGVVQGDIIVIYYGANQGVYRIDDVGPRNSLGSRGALSAAQVEIVENFVSSGNVEAAIYAASSQFTYKTNMASTIYQSDVLVDSIQIARPNSAKFLSLGCDPKFLTSGHTLDLEIGISDGYNRTISIADLNKNRSGSILTTPTFGSVVERLNYVFSNRFDGYGLPVSAYQIGDEISISHNWSGNDEYYLKVLSSGTANFYLGLDDYGADIVDKTLRPTDTTYFYVSGKKLTDIASIIETTANVATTTFTFSESTLLDLGVKPGHLLHVKGHSVADENGTFVISVVTSNTVVVSRNTAFTTETNVAVEILHDAIPLNEFDPATEHSVIETFVDSNGKLGYNQRLSYTGPIANIDVIDVSDNFIASEYSLESVSVSGGTQISLGSLLENPIFVPTGFTGRRRIYAPTNIEFIDLYITSPAGIGSADIVINDHISEEETLELCSVRLNGVTTLTNLVDKRLFGSVGLDELREDIEQALIETPLVELRSNGVVRGFDVIAPTGPSYIDGYVDSALYPNFQGLLIRGGTGYVGGTRCDKQTSTVMLPNTAATYLVALNSLSNFELLSYSLEEILDGYAGDVALIASVTHDGSDITEVIDLRYFINKLDEKFELYVDETNHMVGNFNSFDAAINYANNYPGREKFKIRVVSNTDSDIVIPVGSRDITLVIDGTITNLTVNSSCKVMSESVYEGRSSHITGQLIVSSDCDYLSLSNLSLNQGIIFVDSNSSINVSNCLFDGYSSDSVPLQFFGSNYKEINVKSCKFTNNSKGLLFPTGFAGDRISIDSCSFVSNTEKSMSWDGDNISVLNTVFDKVGVIYRNTADEILFNNCYFTADNFAAIYSYGYLKVINSKFADSTISSTSFIVCEKSSVIENCLFKDLTIATNYLIDARQTKTKVSNCTFLNVTYGTNVAIRTSSFISNTNLSSGSTSSLIEAEHFELNINFHAVTGLTRVLKTVRGNTLLSGSLGYCVDFTSYLDGYFSSVDSNHFTLSSGTGILLGAISRDITISKNYFTGSGTAINLANAGKGIKIIDNNFKGSITPISASSEILSLLLDGNKFENSMVITMQLGSSCVISNNISGDLTITGGGLSTSKIIGNSFDGLTLNCTTVENCQIETNFLSTLTISCPFSNSSISENTLNGLSITGTNDFNYVNLMSNIIESLTDLDGIVWNNSIVSFNAFKTGNAQFTITSTFGGTDANVIIEQNIFEQSLVEILSTYALNKITFSENINNSGGPATLIFNSQTNETIVSGNIDFDIIFNDGANSTIVSENMMLNSDIELRDGTYESVILLNNFVQDIRIIANSASGFVVSSNFINGDLTINDGTNLGSKTINKCQIINNFIVGDTKINTPTNSPGSRVLSFENSTFSNNLLEGRLNIGGLSSLLLSTDSWIFSNNKISNNVITNTFYIATFGAGTNDGYVQILNNSIDLNSTGSTFLLGERNFGFKDNSSISNNFISSNKFKSSFLIGTEANKKCLFIGNDISNNIFDSNLVWIYGFQVNGLTFSQNILKGSSNGVSFLLDLNGRQDYVVSSDDGTHWIENKNIDITNNTFKANVEIYLNYTPHSTVDGYGFYLNGLDISNNSMAESNINIESSKQYRSCFVDDLIISSNFIRGIDLNISSSASNPVGAQQIYFNNTNISNNNFSGTYDGYATPQWPGVTYRNSASNSSEIEWFNMGTNFTNNAMVTPFLPSSDSIGDYSAKFYTVKSKFLIHTTVGSPGSGGFFGLNFASNNGISFEVDIDNPVASYIYYLTDVNISQNNNFNIKLRTNSLNDALNLTRVLVNSNSFRQFSLDGVCGFEIVKAASSTLRVITGFNFSNNTIYEFKSVGLRFLGKSFYSNNYISNFEFDPLIDYSTGSQVNFIGNYFGAAASISVYIVDSDANNVAFWWGNTIESGTNITINGTTITNTATANIVGAGVIPEV